MEGVNYPELVMGIVLLLGSLLGIYRAWHYYSRLSGVWRDLSKRVIVSLIFFALGALGTIAHSWLWADISVIIQAVFYTLSYVLILFVLFMSLRRVSSQKPASKRPQPEDREESNVPVRGGYLLSNAPSPSTLMLLKRASGGLLVVSRNTYDQWVKKSGVEPDKFIWLSRAELEGAVDPGKLHVLQREILAFLETQSPASVYFEGVEYLVLYNDFPGVAKFLFSVKDAVLINNSLMLLFLPKGVLDSKQESVLAREFEPIDEKELTRRILNALPEKERAEITLFGVLPPAGGRESEGSKGAGAESSEEGSGAGEEKTEEA
ncbi:DUF835 domain-containing protein [Thermococcus pacificus]|uniref:DUF835 domain-containing protein n=1 Tax=Thermococcus pacificus TaxID=71998 RepID=UPI000B5A1909|nr:DUF835 domain-containing protein [Thermococcus pacificus]